MLSVLDMFTSWETELFESKKLPEALRHLSIHNLSERRRGPFAKTLFFMILPIPAGGCHDI